MNLLIFTIILFSLNHVEATIKTRVDILRPNVEYRNYEKESGLHETPLHIYCYNKEINSFLNIWQTLILSIDSTEEFSFYEGANVTQIENDFNANKESWHFNLFYNKKGQIKIDPSTPCIGITSKHPYTASLTAIHVDFWKILLLGVGILLFFTADYLSKSPTFIYILGTLTGIFFSLLFGMYFLSKVIPKKSIGAAMFLGSWAVGVYFIQRFWDYLLTYAMEYKVILFWYSAFWGLLSFLVCYNRGPIENPRTLDTIRWILRFIGCVAIYFSTSYKEAAIAQMVILAVINFFPKSLLNFLKIYFKRMFPPRRRLLTEEEYQEEGIVETNKSLEELRKFCKSPDCDQWELVRRCKDPVRLAAFIQGGPHIDKTEMEEYDRANMENLPKWSPPDYEEEDDSEDYHVLQRKQHTRSSQNHYEDDSDDY